MEIETGSFALNKPRYELIADRDEKTGDVFFKYGNYYCKQNGLIASVQDALEGIRQAILALDPIQADAAIKIVMMQVDSMIEVLESKQQRLGQPYNSQ